MDPSVSALAVRRAVRRERAEATDTERVVEVVLDGDLDHEVRLERGQLPPRVLGRRHEVPRGNAEVETLDGRRPAARAQEETLETHAHALVRLHPPAVDHRVAQQHDPQHPGRLRQLVRPLAHAVAIGFDACTVPPLIELGQQDVAHRGVGVRVVQVRGAPDELGDELIAHVRVGEHGIGPRRSPHARLPGEGAGEDEAQRREQSDHALLRETPPAGLRRWSGSAGNVQGTRPSFAGYRTATAASRRRVAAWL